MPILDIEIVVDAQPLPEGLAHSLAEAAGRVFGSLPGQTWVRLRTLPRDQYAENGWPGDTLPVFVTVHKTRRPTGEALEREARLLTTAIAGACDRPPGSVHLLYEPDLSGRIASGGTLQR